jgi:type I restriction enzyme, S subunit
VSATLGSLCQFLNGGTPPKSESRYFEGDIPWITSADITSPIVDTARSFITDEAVGASATNKVPTGTVLLVTRTGVGKVAVAGVDLCFSQDITAILPDKDRLDTAYLVHFLRTKQDYLLSMARGATIKGVTRNVVTDLVIPLPPLPEQCRIAAILDKADALRTKRREALAQLDRLAQAIFVEMFGDTATNPKAWPMASVGEVADVQGGLQVTSARKNLPVEIPYLRVANVYRGRLQLDEVKTIRATASEVARTKLVPQDMLVVEGHGNPEEVGRGALWDGEIEECVHQNHLIRVRFDSSKVAPAFACEYLNSPGGRQHLLRAGKTTSGLNTISVSNVRTVPIALPPLVAQKAFEQRLGEVGQLKTVHQAAFETTDALFTSLQHRAFRGEL